MEFYNLKSIWLCKLAKVSRQGKKLEYDEPDRSFLVVQNEENSSEKVEIIDFFMYAKKGEKAQYYSLSGKECFHGTQKTVFTPRDIGKIFVVSRKSIPKRFLTDREIETGKISLERLRELEIAFREYRW